MLNDYFNTIFDNFIDGIYITDHTAKTIYLNHSYELITGLTKSRMLGQNMADLVEDNVISLSGTLHVLKDKKTFTAEQRFCTGRRCVIRSFPIFMENDSQLLFVVTTVREITEIYNIKKELHRQERINQKYSKELRELRKELDGDVDLVALDSRMVSMLHFTERVAMVDSPVLLLGEPGAGKERLARFIHEHSSREKNIFQRITFSTLPKDHYLEYLFGRDNAKNADMHIGILDTANGGTVYIDELMDIPMVFQGQMLSLLSGEPCITGDGSSRKLNLRLIAGTRHTMEELRGSPKINPELLDYFSLFPITVPPLREHKDDIVPLLKFYLRRYNQKTGESKVFGRDCYEKLLSYSWPGNVQELCSVVQRAAIISEEDIIGVEDLSVDGNIEYVNEKLDELPEKVNLKEEVEKLEADYMSRAFEKYKNTRDAAKSLSMDNSTFVRKRKRYEECGLMKTRMKKRGEWTKT